MQLRMSGVFLVMIVLVMPGCSPQEQQPATEPATLPAPQSSMPVAPAPVPEAQEMVDQASDVGTDAVMTAEEAIERSLALDLSQRADYLLAQAQALFDAADFEPVMTLAQYVLQNVDAESVRAAELLAQAEEKMNAAVQMEVEGLKDQIGITGETR